MSPLFEDFEIDALSDEALELVAGGKSSDSPYCCSCRNCSDECESGHCCGDGDGGTGHEIDLSNI